MATQQQSVTYFNFSGGLNTEASVVNIPPNDATDLLNVKLNRNGSVERRPGIDFISATDAGEFYDEELGDYSQYDEVPSTGVFSLTKPNGVTTDYVAIHVGTKIKVYEYTNYLSLGLIDEPVFEEDILAYGTEDMKFYKTQFLKTRNSVYIINKNCQLLYLSYDSGGNIEINSAEIFFRDIDDVKDAEVDSYVNQGGKNYKCIKSVISTAFDLPGAGELWATYWVVNGVTDPNYPTYAFGQNYKSNIEAVVSASTDKGWRTATVSAGRLWLSGIGSDYSKIYFSQTIVSDAHATRMYQFADPYNKYDSDIVDTDGGTFTIADADEILRLESYKGGVLVFATNGVWFIGGENGGTFKATAYSVTKVSDDGLAGYGGVSQIESIVCYFGLSGAYVITMEDITATPQVKNISNDKIDSFYNNDISLYNKSTGTAVSNVADRKLYFFTNFTDTDWTSQRNKFNVGTHYRDILIFDFNLGAWTKYSLASDEDGSKVAIGDIFTIKGSSLDFSQVVDGLGNPVETEALELVEAIGAGGGASAKLITTLVLMKMSDTKVEFAFGTLEGTSPQDFSLNVVDAEYASAYIDSAQQIFNDIGHNKQIPYLTTLFNRVDGGGCLYTAIWNWANSTKSFKYGTARQAYLPNKWNIEYEDNSGSGLEVVKNKHRVRGNGNAIQLRFESDGNKPFHLYGWQMDVSVSRKV